ncbi:MAG: glucose/ribitol short chain dehydrogenase/reductase family protein, partial [bacterium]
MELDLGSFSSIRRFVKEIEEKNLPLNALVCNAAVQMNKRLVLSPDGYELTFAVNHLGHFLLTNLLIERLLANSSRIVIVASGVHDPKMNTGMPKPFFSDIDALASTGGSDKNKYNGQLAYVNSKLCNL